MNGTIFSIEHGSFVDGPGIRTAVFFKGCNLDCAWCHNPESKSFRPERLYFEDKCCHCGKCQAVCPSPDHCILCGKCAEVCPQAAIQISGYEVSSEQVLQEILADRVFYGDSGDPLTDGGATFSGGECLLQPDFLKELLRGCKEAGVTTAVDTAGCVPFSVFERILPLADLFLYDLKVMDPEKHLQYTGTSNSLILENYQKLIEAGKKVIVRVPVIPGVNAEKDDIIALRAFYDKAGWPEKTELLPYHKMGENKVRALRKAEHEFTVPDQERMDSLKKLLQ